MIIPGSPRNNLVAVSPGLQPKHVLPKKCRLRLHLTRDQTCFAHNRLAAVVVSPGPVPKTPYASQSVSQSVSWSLSQSLGQSLSQSVVCRTQNYSRPYRKHTGCGCAWAAAQNVLPEPGRLRLRLTRAQNARPTTGCLCLWLRLASDPACAVHDFPDVSHSVSHPVT